MKYLLVGIFGLLGVYLRFALDTYYSHNGQALPLATFISNIVGCTLAGIIFGFLHSKGPAPIYTGLLTGFCGGLTTFSGFNLQVLNLFNQGLNQKAMLYLALTPTIGVILILGGYNITLKLLN